MLVSVLVVLVLFLSALGGFKEGAVKSFFSLLALIIAITLTGIFYGPLSSVISFLPGENMEQFIGFLITLALINVILNFVFFLPRKSIQIVWREGLSFRIIGGILKLLSSAVGMVVFALLVRAYPIMRWLEQTIAGSGVLTWLTVHLTFVQAMLPEVFRITAIMV